MKKTALFIGLLAFSLSSQAQLGFTPEIGVNFTSVNSTVKSGGSSTSLKGKMNPGFRAGASLTLSISESFAIQPGLYYDFTSTKYNLASVGNSSLKSTMSLHSLQIPVYAMYYMDARNKTGFFAGVGPYANFYLSGKQKGDLSIGETSTNSSRDLSFGNKSSDDLKSMGFGGSLTAGYTLPAGLSLRAYFNLGLSNLKPKGDSDNKINSKSVGLTLGYRF